MVYITCASFELRSLNQKCIRRHQSTRPCHVMSQKDYSGEENIWGKNGENVFDKDQTLYYGLIHCAKNEWKSHLKSGVTEARRAEGTNMSTNYLFEFWRQKSDIFLIFLDSVKVCKVTQDTGTLNRFPLFKRTFELFCEFCPDLAKPRKRKFQLSKTGKSSLVKV